MNRGSLPELHGAQLAYRASMRPRFMNRGSFTRQRRRGLGPDASMRPRFMNRGSADLPALQQDAQAASMRPRFMNRGSAAAWIPTRSGTPGFNEAPIHESGKYPMAKSVHHR